ncbi:MAG: FecR family protein, partial [Thermohalobaculum sp.]|nr:FecR family protein [Thermohalobaculum sp.]
MGLPQIGRMAALAILGIAFSGAGAAAGTRCGPDPAVEIVALDGSVSIEAPDGGRATARLGDTVCRGDLVATGDDGRVELRFRHDETTIGLARNTSVRIPEASGGVELTSGLMRFISSVRELFTIRTRHANAGIDGTEAVVATDPDGTLVLVIEGEVTLQAAGTALALPAGAAGFAAPGAAPRPAEPATVPPAFRALVVEPEGASDWAIHIPPIL